MKVTRINIDGSMNDIQLKLTPTNICKQLQQKSTSQGSKKIKELYYWNYDNCIIKCYGWMDGDPGFENKHDLPPSGISSIMDEDSSTVLLFGDVFIVRFEGKVARDIDVSDYAGFYSMSFAGFDDCDDDEDEDDGFEDESQEEDEDYDINEENEEDEEDPYEYMSDEAIEKDDLVEDTTDY